MGDKQVLTVNRALSELKTLDNRISKAIEQGNYVGVSIGGKIKGFNNIDEFNNHVKSSFQKTKDLIRRRSEIKSKIVESNAKTKVTIGGQEMTVAEAIERKSSIEYDKHYLAKLKKQYSQVLQYIEDSNEEMNYKIDQAVNNHYGNTEKKISESDYDLIAQPIIKRDKAELVDPENIKKEIEHLEETIEEFETEVDHVLSESNVITKIEISNV